MGFFDLFKSEKHEQRDADTTTGTSITSLFSGEDYVSEDTIQKIPTAKACTELISGTIAQLPIYLYKETDKGIVRVTGDKRENLLNSEPNEFQTGFNFKKQIVKDFLNYGFSYTYIDRLGNDISELVNLKSRNIYVEKYIQDGYRIVDADIRLYTTETGRHIRTPKKKILNTFKPYECLIVLSDSHDGLTSKGVLEKGKDVFKIALEEKKYTSSIYKNGALPLGVLKSQNRLTKPVIDRLRESWQSLYTGGSNAGKTVILEEGLDYTPVSLKPGDLLLTDNRKDVVSDICKLYNCPESLIDVSKIKYGSLEQNNIHFLQYTLSPIITAIEDGLNKSILLEQEKEEGYFFSFDTSEVLRTTDGEKYSAIKTALDGGFMSINEARYKLNLPAIEDDIMKWTLGAVLYYPKTGEMKIPNMGIGIDGFDDSSNKDTINSTDSSVAVGDSTDPDEPKDDSPVDDEEN